MRRVSFIAVAAVLLVSACDSTPARPEPPLAPVGPVPFAYARDGALSVVRAGHTVATVDLRAGERVSRVEWTPDAGRLLALTSGRLLSVDTTSGKSASVDCSCTELAVAGGRVFTLASYGAREFAGHDLATLAPTGPLRPQGVGERGMMLAAGAGERLVAFAITADGARPFTDVLVVDPGNGTSRVVGKTDAIGTPAAAAYTSRGWHGGPTVAYLANASTGASSSTASLVWFDPAQGGQHVVDDASMRSWSGAGPSGNSAAERLWWGRDGTPHVTARLFDGNGADIEPAAPWRYDGTTWLRTDDAASAEGRTELRDLGDGVLAFSPDSGDLVLEKRALADDADGVWTPPLTSAPAGIALTVVNLNAAMGYHLRPGDPAGTDATAADFADLADDILRQNGDVANLQEMAEPAAEHLRRILAERTGQQWHYNWAASGEADYYEGRSPSEGPAAGYAKASAGNAQLIRIGHGVKAYSSTTGRTGTRLESGARSYGGVTLTTTAGLSVDIYVTHLARSKDAREHERVRDIRQLQEHLDARRHPVVLTGDFNESVDLADGGPTQPTVEALRQFMTRHRFVDVGRDLGATSNQKGAAAELEGSIRIDYILTRDLPTQATARFVSHQSDHWGLATTVGSYPVAAVPPQKAPPAARPETAAPPDAGAAPAGPTPEGAIARYERYLHAIGAGDVTTICEIAGPAAKKAEDEGVGPCEQTISLMLSMYSPREKTALKSATVDPAKVTARGTTVTIPHAAHRVAIAMGPQALPDSEMSYLDGQWFLTD